MSIRQKGFHIFLTIIFTIVVNSSLYSQKEKFNRLSIEFNSGLSVKRDSSSQGKLAYGNFELGGRLMFLKNHGIRLFVGINPNKNDVNFTSFTKTFLIRYNAMYVFNLGRTLHIEKVLPRFSILTYIGGGLSTQHFKESKGFTNWKTNNADEQVNFAFGFTPQYNFNDKIEFHLDFSSSSFILQTFDQKLKFSDLTKRSQYGTYLNASFGIMYYIGKNKRHVDWRYYLNGQSDEDQNILSAPINDSISQKDSLKFDLLNDTDKDGIIDSLDLCPEEFGIAEYEGCPKPETSFDCYVNEFPVFTFQKGIKQLNEIFYSDLDKIAECLKNQPLKKILVYGHTDDHRNEFFIEELSKNRALEIKNLLVKRGIDSERILTIGESDAKAKIPDSIYQSIKHNRVVYFKHISNNKNDLRNIKTNEFVQKLVFTVQVGAYYNPIKNQRFDKYGEVYISKTDDGLTRYSVNLYDNYEAAYEKWKQLRNLGFFQDAFVTAYYLGERISLKEAKEILKK